MSSLKTRHNDPSKVRTQTSPLQGGSEVQGPVVLWPNTLRGAYSLHLFHRAIWKWKILIESDLWLVNGGPLPMPISKYDINRSIRSQISKFSARWNLGLSNYDACHVTEGKNFYWEPIRFRYKDIKKKFRIVEIFTEPSSVSIFSDKNNFMKDEILSQHETIFNLMSKVIRGSTCFGFVLPRSAIGPEKSRHFLN